MYTPHFVYSFICVWTRVAIERLFMCLLLFDCLLWRSEMKVLSCVRLFATPWTVHGILQARILEWIAFSMEEGMATVFLPEESLGQRSLARYSPHQHACKAALYWKDTGDIPEKNLHFFLFFFFFNLFRLHWLFVAASSSSCLWHVGS